MIGISLVVGVGIPTLLCLINQAIGSQFLKGIAGISALIGIVLLILFFIHLRIELMQDQKIEQYYSKHRNVKIILENGYCECGACGNRLVRKHEVQCGVCGIRFGEETNKTPQEILDEK